MLKKPSRKKENVTALVSLTLFKSAFGKITNI
jgi:hypothetical protein